MVYRELRETCSKLGEEMFSKSALPYSFLSTAVERKEYGSGKISI